MVMVLVTLFSSPANFIIQQAAVSLDSRQRRDWSHFTWEVITFLMSFNCPVLSLYLSLLSSTWSAIWYLDLHIALLGEGVLSSDLFSLLRAADKKCHTGDLNASNPW